MKKKLVITLIIAVFIIAPLNALAEKLTFVTAEWEPYVIKKDKEVIGSDVDTIREICKRLGIEAEIEEVPWKRALKYVEEGKADAIFTPKYTEERAEFLYYPSEPLNIEKMIIAALKGSGIKLEKMDDLKNQTVGVVRGYVYNPEFDNYQEIKRETCDDDNQLLKILAHKRLSLAAFTDEGNLKFISKKSGIEVETVYVLSEIPSFVAFSKKALGEKGKELAEKFSQALRQLKDDGTFQKIRSKYF